MTILQNIQPDSVSDHFYAQPTADYIDNKIRQRFEQLEEDIACEEFEVSGDYSAEELVKKFLF